MKTLLSAVAICALALSLGGLVGCAAVDCSGCEGAVAEACEESYQTCVDGGGNAGDCADAAELGCDLAGSLGL
jgi:hypothetical protein